MFSDPQSITVNAVAQTLPAVSRTSDSSIYSKEDGLYKLIVSRKYLPARKRFSIRVDTSKIAADPLSSANNKVYSTSAYIVVDAPTVGYTNAELRDVAVALSAWCSSANLMKVLGGET